MGKILAIAHIFGLTVMTRLRDRASRGLESGELIEKVVITAAMLAVAIVLAAVITNAVNNRATAIN